MFDLIRTSLHRVITTPVGDRFLPVRLPKDLARRVNMTLGTPICDRAELERRRAAREQLAKLRSAGTSSSTESSGLPRVAAPVVVYFEKDRNARLLGRIKEALDAKGIAYTELDVTGDANTKNYVMREAKCKEDDLPIVFVATAVVGGYNDLVEWDVSGKLATAVYGAPPARAPKA
jgi:glutaredoxin